MTWDCAICGDPITDHPDLCAYYIPVACHLCPCPCPDCVQDRQDERDLEYLRGN